MLQGNRISKSAKNCSLSQNWLRKFVLKPPQKIISFRQEALNATAVEINEKISKYAVLKLTATTEKSSKSVTKGSAPTAKKNNQKSKELAEVEAELEVNSTF